MLKHILPLIPKHNLYCEPYAGGAAVYFAKEPAKLEVINDLNNELINFYTVLKTEPNVLKKSVGTLLHCRSHFEHARHIYKNPQFFNKVQRAASFWLLSKLCFSGIIGNSMGINKDKPARAIKLMNAKKDFQIAVDRIENTTIECDCAIKVIQRYDNKDTFFFLDTPYIGCDMGHYNNMFNEQSLIELLNTCEKLKGKFMLTMYPNETIKEYANKNNWDIHEVERRVTACKSEYQRKQIEWMVCNYTV